MPQKKLGRTKNVRPTKESLDILTKLGPENFVRRPKIVYWD